MLYYLNHKNLLAGQTGNYILVLFFVFVAFVFNAYGQDDKTFPQTRPRTVSEGPIIPSDEVIRIDTDLITFDATVTNEKGETIRNLQPTDFKLYEDGIERPISFFNIERKTGAKRPVAIVFALDVSGSMSPEEFVRLSEAMRVFIKNLADRQSVFAIMTFGMKVKTLQSFTNDTAKLEKAFEKLQREESGLSTHAYDGVDDAIRLLVNKAPRTRNNQLIKRSVLVVSDGFPVGDTVAPKTVIERANAADVSIYSVTLPSYSRFQVSKDVQPLPTPWDVSGLVDRTGGRNFYANEKDFTQLFKLLAEEVLSSYTLAFYPAEEKKNDGKYHEVRIEGPRGLIIKQSRPGYQSNKQ